MKQKLARLLVGLTIVTSVFGGSLAYEAASAERASAFTRSNCYPATRLIMGSDGARYIKQIKCYYDYNWWEETFQGKRDGWYWDYNPTLLV